MTHIGQNQANLRPICVIGVQSFFLNPPPLLSSAHR